MLEPGESTVGLEPREMADCLHNSLSDIMEEEGPSSDVRNYVCHCFLLFVLKRNKKLPALCQMDLFLYLARHWLELEGWYVYLKTDMKEKAHKLQFFPNQEM